VQRPRWVDHVAAALPFDLGTVPNERVIDHFSGNAP
jgi:hypothetical protein